MLSQVNHLSNPGYETYNTVNGIDQPAAYNRYGRQHLLAVSYKM